MVTPTAGGEAGGGGSAKPNSFLNPHMWYSNDSKKKQVNGEWHILVLVRKQLSDFNYNGVLKEISMFRRVYLKPITTLTFPAYKTTRLN